MTESFLRMLGNPIISKINFDLNGDFKSEDFDFNVNLKILKKIQKNENVAKSFLKIIIFDEKNYDRPFYLEIEAFANFEWSNEVENDKIDAVLNLNTPAIILSYLRPFVSEITLFSGNPALVLPLINFQSGEIENY